MTWIADSLWHMLTGSSARVGERAVKTQRNRAQNRKENLCGRNALINTERSCTALVRPEDTSLPMQHRYDALVKLMKQKYGLRVRKWRSNSSGCAWQVYYHDGTITRLIESPYPRGPMSCAIFLHEVGHHAIGLGAYRPRCLEEYHAWQWSLETMRQYRLNVTASVEKRMHESLHYAVCKAARRGLKQVPPELAPFVLKPRVRAEQT